MPYHLKIATGFTVENLEKEITRKETIKNMFPSKIPLFLPSTTKNKKQTQNLSIQKLELPSQKKKCHIDHNIKEVCKHHYQKYMDSKIPIPGKKTPATSKLKIDNTLLSLSKANSQMI